MQSFSKASPFSGLSTPHQGFLWMENYGLQALNFLEESPALHRILGECASRGLQSLGFQHSPILAAGLRTDTYWERPDLRDQPPPSSMEP